MNDFILHPQIAADSAFITDWPSSQLRIMNDTRYPWLLLIPRFADLSQLSQLSHADSTSLMQELQKSVILLQTCWPEIEHTNVASLGNKVKQMHWHVIGRKESDTAWPNPIWGVGEAVPYDDTDLQSLIIDIQMKLTLHFS